LVKLFVVDTAVCEGLFNDRWRTRSVLGSDEYREG